MSSLSLSRVVEDASRLAATNFKPLVHMAVVPTQEDSLVHLVPVVDTGFGARLYFSTCASDETSQSARPSTLNLLHVHLPPGFAPSVPPQRPNDEGFSSSRTWEFLFQLFC